MSAKSKELTVGEKKLFEAVDKNDPQVLKALLVDYPNVNILDPENLMTPLQHAAYKGNIEIVQILLDHGADVNLCEHQHNYTALHFAGLSGNVEVCIALLLAGAKSDITNTVQRTAAQMAAFVGHHNCVSVINNFVPLSEIHCYTNQDKPLLPPNLADEFHKFIMQVSVHPMKIILNLSTHQGLLGNLPEVRKVLELMSDKEMKRGSEINEVMSFKFHYLQYIIGEVIQIRENLKNKQPDEKKHDFVEVFAKKILKPGQDGSLELMDAFLRGCIRQYPFKECTLLRQMVVSIASPEPPAALNVISAAINGQRGFMDGMSACGTCGEERPEKKCSKCKVVQYCDRNCQRLHWHWHKKSCAQLSNTNMANEQGTTKLKPDVDEIAAEVQNVLIQN